MSALRRDRLGARRILFHPESGHVAEDLRSLLSLVPAARAGGLDAAGIAAALALGDAPDRTCLTGVRAVPPGHTLTRAAAPSIVTPPPQRSPPRPHPRSHAPLAPALLLATARALSAARSPVLSLSGGLDAPLALLAARRAGVTVAHAIHLSLPATTYDESLAARETAAALGLTLHEICITAQELAAELPRAVRVAETPLYNLHPVSRSIVARTARERGHDVLLTGDGADQAACGGAGPADYVPIVAALTRGAGVALASPFLDDEVIDILASAPDPGKRSLRELARTLGLPAVIADRPKIAAFAPPLPRAAFPDAQQLAALAGLAHAATGSELADGADLARTLGFAFDWSSDDRRNVGIASLAAFVSAFELGSGLARGGR